MTKSAVACLTEYESSKGNDELVRKSDYAFLVDRVAVWPTDPPAPDRPWNQPVRPTAWPVTAYSTRPQWYTVSWAMIQMVL